MTEPHRPRGPRGPDDDLRALLDDAVSDVDPPPALDRIRERTQNPSQTRAKVTTMSDKRPWIFGIAGAVAATAATLVGVTVLTNNDDPATTSGPAATPTATADPDPEPSDEPTVAEPSEDSSPATERKTTVPVYYLGAAPQGPRLYREFHTLKTTSDDVVTSAEEALAGAPLDPDYYSPWGSAGLSVASVDQGSNGVTLDLEGDASASSRPAGVTAAEAKLAVQQLVYTVTAARQDTAPVTLTLNGSATDKLLGVNVSKPQSRAGGMQVLAPVWVFSPQDGDRVGGTFTVEGQGAFFEANVSWQLLTTTGDVVKDGFATAEECCTLSPYSFKVGGVPSGDYVLRVYSADESGGEGNAEAEDTKRITVR